MKTLTFEIEVETDDLTRISGLQLSLQREGSEAWQSALLFRFPRPTRVRNGKHLKINSQAATVVAVGEG